MVRQWCANTPAKKQQEDRNGFTRSRKLTFGGKGHLARTPSPQTPHEAKGKAKMTITGRHVLLAMIAFFGVIFIANAIFIYLALDSYTGLDTKSAYEKGRNFNAELAEAKAQAARGWQVNINLDPASDGTHRVTMVPKDSDGNSISGLVVMAHFKRPTQANLDKTAELIEHKHGTYDAQVNLTAKGQWILELTAKRDNQQVYKSRNRIVVK